MNRKQIAFTKSPDRNQQLLYVAQQKERFAAQGLPVINDDAKKKELMGNLKNPGAKWDHTPILVKDHDFRSEAKALVTPYGIYDTKANRGSVFLGTNHDSPGFCRRCHFAVVDSGRFEAISGRHWTVHSG